jgi:molecular chaperone DnaK (HSP70)
MGDFGQDEQNEYSAFESQADLVIGIDFGTTFTGVAYAHTKKAGNLFSRDKTPKNLADKVVVIKNWPGPGQLDKIPTALAYHTNPPTWGQKVRPEDDPQVRYFKLLLQENVGEKYEKSVSGRAHDLYKVFDANWYHPQLAEMEPIDYAADYLKAAIEYVRTQSLLRHYGQNFLESQQISYVITVPAIWSDKAKDLTRKAAERAGIHRRKLVLITEPEAAALYCATLCREVDLTAGDKFLICDAGGGTVVRTPCPFTL